MRLAWLLALPLLALPAAASADCAAGSVGVWPSPDRPLDARGRLVLDAYGADRAWVRDIARHRPRLEGAGAAIPLEVVQTYEGAFETTQVVLRARRPLRPGRRYRFVMSGRPNPRIRGAGGPRVPMVWTTAAGDPDAPRWTSAPRLADTSFTAFGCGPAIYAHVAVAVTDASAVLYRVTVRPASGGPARSHLVPARDGRVDVGHGMCSGPFVLDAGVRYLIELAAIDAAGHETPAPGGPLEAVGPSPSY